MAETFTYTANIGGDDGRLTSPPPIWSDFDPNSKYSMIARNAKQRNGPDFWDKMRSVFEHDLETLPMSRFKVWASSMIVPIVNTFKTHEQLCHVLGLASFYDAIKRAITDPIVGCTQQDFDSMFRVVDNLNISMNRVQALYGLSFGTDNSVVFDLLDGQVNSIVELGAGIGDMADVCRQMGFTGDYTIYDFPELLNIQKWYHKNIPNHNFTKNKYIWRPEEVQPADLCIATWSLTEMPILLRDELVSRLRDTPRWLIAFSNKIFGFDNYDYIMNVFLPQIGADSSQANLIPVVYDGVSWENWDGGTYYLYVDKTKQHTS